MSNPAPIVKSVSPPRGLVASAVLILSLAGCIFLPPRAPKPPPATPESCAALKSEIDHLQTQPRTTASSDPEIAAAALGKSDLHLDELKAQYRSMGCHE